MRFPCIDCMCGFPAQVFKDEQDKQSTKAPSSVSTGRRSGSAYVGSVFNEIPLGISRHPDRHNSQVDPDILICDSAISGSLEEALVWCSRVPYSASKCSKIKAE